MRKKLTKNQQLFKKEINRIKDGLRKAEKRGFLPDYNLIPQIPKRVSKKALEEIRKVKPRDIYIKGEWVDFETGKVITAHQRVYQGRPTYPDYVFTPTTVSDYKAERQAEKITESFPDIDFKYVPPVIPESAVMPAEDVAYTIIQNLREEIMETLSKPHLQQIMNNWLDLMLQKFGEEDTAEAIEAIGKSFRQWINDSAMPDYEAMFEYQDAFFEELAKILGDGGKGWIEDAREELMYSFV